MFVKRYLTHKEGDFKGNFITIGSPTINEYIGLPGYRLYIPSLIVNDSYYCINENMQDKKVYLWDKNCTSPEQLAVVYDNYLSCNEDTLSIVSPTLTINEYKRYRVGVVSGFSTSDYLKLPHTIPICTTVEFGGKIRHNATSGNRCIFELSKSGWDYGFNIAVGHDKLRLWTGSGWGSQTTLNVNTDYWFKCVCNSSGSTLYISTDGKTYTQDVFLSANEFSSWVGATVYLGIRGYDKTEAFSDGSIDLSQSYIKINDEYWWSGFYPKDEHVNKHYAITKKDIIHKIGDFKREYQLVNSPKIDSNGIASGFNSRNGIQIGSFKPGSSPWEIGCLLTTGSDVSTSTIAFGSMNSSDYKCPLFGYISGKWRMLLSSNGSSWNLAADLTNGLVSPNTTYFVKFVFTGSRYILFVDDIPVIVLDSSTTIYQGGVVGFGNNMYSTSSQSYFNGTIDISKCYIKINGEYWWTGFYTENVLGVKRYLTNRNINNMIIVPSETILNTSTPGTYTLDLEDGDYDVVVVGAGGGGSGCSKHSDGASGASGSAFVGTITLTAGTYNVVVGAGGVGTPRMDWSRGGTGGSSSIGDLIIAGGGTGGALDASGGTGGSLTLNIVPKSYTVKSNGRNGAGGYGWGQTSTVASPYGGYGYGGYGGQCDWQGGGTGGNGYISLIRLGYMKEK